MKLKLNLLLVLVLLLTFVMAEPGKTRKSRRRKTRRNKLRNSAAKKFVDTKVRIIGGQVADPYQFPELVSIQRNYGRWPRHFCGGTILNEEYVLTAAHCLVDRDPKKIQCVSATNDLQSSSGRVHQVVRLINHHVYHRTNLKHDIALIQVTPKFIFDGREAPTKLPPKSYQVPIGTRATVVGWGRTEHRGKPVDKLQFVTDVIIDTETCKNRMLELVGPWNICGTNEGALKKGFCMGDSGGPFFYEEYQIGVVSWFMNECGTGPSVYTKISEHIDWINKQIAPYKV